jgi:hypothetical protein
MNFFPLLVHFLCISAPLLLARERHAMDSVYTLFPLISDPSQYFLYTMILSNSACLRAASYVVRIKHCVLPSGRGPCT